MLLDVGSESSDWDKKAQFEDEDMMEYGYVQNRGPRWRQALHTEHDDEKILEHSDVASDTECVLDCLDADDRPNGAISFEKREEMWEKAERERWGVDKRIDTDRLSIFEDAEYDAGAGQERNNMTEKDEKDERERLRDRDEFSDPEGLYSITPNRIHHRDRTRLSTLASPMDNMRGLSPLASNSTIAFISPQWDNAHEESSSQTSQSAPIPVATSKSSIPVTVDNNMIERFIRIYENEARRASGTLSPARGPQSMTHKTTGSLNKILHPTVQDTSNAARSIDSTTKPT